MGAQVGEVNNNMAIQVFVNGTFDIIHHGHLQLLNYAKSLGNHLTVGIDSDARVKQLKGPGRPINSEFERKELLENLKAVDKVVVFDTDDELVQLVANCDIMVKGTDYTDKPIVGREVCRELVFYKVIDGYSTTNKIQNIAAGR